VTAARQRLWLFLSALRHFLGPFLAALTPGQCANTANSASIFWRYCRPKLAVLPPKVGGTHLCKSNTYVVSLSSDKKGELSTLAAGVHTHNAGGGEA
jgi:hypothetical protein